MSIENPQEDNPGGLIIWNPKRLLRSFSSTDVRLSRGFLRCRPEKWFPGLAGHWLPLIHSMGVELKVQEIRPALSLPSGLVHGFSATVDDEPFAVFLDPESLRTILAAAGGGVLQQFAGVSLVEYLVRRLITSLSLSWSGPESSIVRYEPDLNPASVGTTATLHLAVSLNGNVASLWFAIGKLAAERLDGLWKRQLRANARLAERPLVVHLELAQLAVPPSMLADYTRAGAVIDLEVPVRDAVTLRLGTGPQSKIWSNARIFQVGGHLGFEMIPGPTMASNTPDGTTRLAIEFGSVSIDSGVASELAQGGAQFETDLKLTERVMLTLNGERVAEATLCTYEGRFAISVA